MKSYIKVHKQKFKKKIQKTTKIQVQAYNTAPTSQARPCDTVYISIITVDSLSPHSH